MGRYLTGHGVEIKYAVGAQSSDYEDSSKLAIMVYKKIAIIEKTDPELTKILENIDDTITYNHDVWVSKSGGGAEVRLSGLCIVSNMRVAKHVLSKVGINDIAQLRDKQEGFVTYDGYISSIDEKIIKYWEDTLGYDLYIDESEIRTYQLWDQIELHNQLIESEGNINEDEEYEFHSEY